MKKLISITAILLAFTACNNLAVKKTTVEVANSSNLYTKNGKTYNIMDDQLFTGVMLNKDDYYNETEISKFVKGQLKEVKKIADNKLIKKISFDEKGNISGDIYFKNDYKVFDGKLVNGLFQGKIEYDDYYDTKDVVSYVNSVIHGPTVRVTDGKETTIYFNKGMEVANKSEVEEFNELTLPLNPKLFSLLELNNETMIYTDETGKIFDGIAIEKNNDEYSYYKIDSGKLSEISSYQEEYFNDYNSDFSFYTPTQTVKFNEDGTQTIITYDAYSKLGSVLNYSECDKDGKVNGKVIEYDSDGGRIEKYEYNGELSGEARIYDSFNKLTAIHNYEKDRYTIVGYYDFDKGIKKVEGQGIKDENGYHRTGTWKWYYDNGNVNQEVEFFYYDNYAMSKSYYEDGTLKEEGKMTYCACYYIGEIRNYDKSGTLSSIDIYDTEGNGNLIKTNKM